MTSSSNKAWVTLATNDSYSLGALVLAHSLKTVNTVHKLAILITPGVTEPMRKQIEAVYDEVKLVDVLDSKDETHLALMSRPELGVTFTKLHCWTLTNFDKCVFLDADTLVLQNCDELFEREELSAAPDPGWPDCFNTGVFVFKPSQNTFSELLEFARTRGSFDGGDQGLLNMFFKEWAHKDISKHLPFTYNVVWSSTYSYLPALKQFGKNMKIVHFIASSKPWLQSFNTETRLVTATSGGVGLQSLLQLWWDLFCRHVHPALSTEMIENRLSSRYSYDNPPEVLPNDYNFTYKPPHKPTYEQEDHYNFIDPWEEYLVSNDQIKYEVEETHNNVCQTENVRGDGNSVEVNMDELCEQKINVNLGIYCEQKMDSNNVNICDAEKQTRDYSFQNRIEECNKIEYNITNIEDFGGVEQFYKEKEEQDQRNNENNPAWSDDIPFNLSSTLNVCNSFPDSPKHFEVPEDQKCDSNGGLAGQFARVPLGEKSTDGKAIEDFLRRQSWEQGNADYLGKDSFSNIWAKINETLGQTPEVKIESGAVKITSPPEVVHTEEPKPLKSALKKTSTTSPPVESELIKPGEAPVKQLEKLDLSKDDLKRVKAPDTPTVTSPTPPTTPATHVQESPKPEPTELLKEVLKSSVGTNESLQSVEQKLPKPDPVEPVKETTKPDPVEPVDETPKSEACTKESLEPVKIEQKLSEPDLSAQKVNEPAKEILLPTETSESTQTSVESAPQQVSNDPPAPVPPKRTNKATNLPKNVQPSEKK